MLIQFNFKNFKSFRDEGSLDLSATKMTEHKEHVVEIANDKLLKVAAIYGANASGKSNVYEAFEFMSYYVIESFKFGGESDKRQKADSDYIKVTPFRFDQQSRKAESTFEVFFVDNADKKERIYQYGFSLRNDEVVEEWLYSKAKTARDDYKTIFYRKKGEKLEAPGLPKNSEENLKVALEKETLLVSLGAKLKIKRLKAIRDWFNNNEIVDFGNPIEAFVRSQSLPDGFVKDEAIQKDVVNYFSSFDESICGFKVEETNSEQADESKQSYRIESLHKMTDCDEYETIPLKAESSGTLKMFALYPSLKNVFDNGGILFVDELNARLHPLLVRNIILTFLSPEINVNHAQLIFTTHDIWQFSKELLRRDEIWLVNKNEQGVSELYSLSEFKDEAGNKVRSDATWSKGYLAGSFGAIPILKPMVMFKREDEDA